MQKLGPVTASCLTAVLFLCISAVLAPAYAQPRVEQRLDTTTGNTVRIAVVEPGIINVPADQPTIQAGIDTAVDGDTVLVAEGTYFENINFKGKVITVASHFILDADTSHISKTIIDGSQPSHPDSASVVYFISEEDTNSVLTGFSITGGRGTIAEDFDERNGGGILMGGGRISHNKIFNNSISYRAVLGVGVLVAQESDLVTIIEHNEIYENHGESTPANKLRYSDGAGIASASAGEVRIMYNKVYDNTLRNGNLFGIGIYCGGFNYPAVEGKAVVEGNLVQNNIGYPTTVPLTAGFAAGAGIVVTNTDADLINNKILNNSFVDNPLDRSVGGGVSLLWSPVEVNLFNNIIAGNHANEGGGIQINPGQNDPGPKATMINNVIYANKADASGGGIDVEYLGQIVINTVLWNNMAPAGPQIFSEPGDITVAYSDVQEGWAGDNNIDENPLFLDTLFYHLSDTSPCIGAGTASYLINGTQYDAPAYDIDGNARPSPPGTAPDIGAWESPLVVTDVEDNIITGIPENFHLEQNYPNPFNPETTIRFTIDRHASVTLEIYNPLGQRIATLLDEPSVPGVYEIVWNGQDDGGSRVSSGAYMYRLAVKDIQGKDVFSTARSMVLLK